MKNIVFLTTICLTWLLCSAATQPKQQYRIFNAKGVEVTNVLCEKALTGLVLDRYRMLETRRNIFLEPEGTTELIRVELFSAKELESMYGKPISPLTLKEKIVKQNPVFILFKVGVLKIKNYINNH